MQQSSWTNKAYDSTWYMGLIYKLIQLNILEELIGLIEFSSSQVVQSQDEKSCVRARVPQASRLSPMLYNLYTSDTPKYVQRELFVYADGICVYHKNRSPRFAHLSVQPHLNEIVRWVSE